MPLHLAFLVSVTWPREETVRTLQQQIYLQHTVSVKEIYDVPSYICNVNQNQQAYSTLPVHIDFPWILEPPEMKRDREREEFLQGEKHCQNLINQDLMFLQPSLTYAPRQTPPELSLEEQTGEQLIIENSNNPLSSLQENHHLEDNFQQASAVDTIYDRSHSTNQTAPFQPVEPVLGLTPEEQKKRKENLKLTLTELLGLTPCTGYVQTPLQTLDGINVNQPSRCLLLAQEAKKLVKKLKEKQEASQWAGILPEKLL